MELRALLKTLRTRGVNTLPGLADRSIKHIADLTPTAYAAEDAK